MTLDNELSEVIRRMGPRMRRSELKAVRAALRALMTRYIESGREVPARLTSLRRAVRKALA